MMTLSVKIDDDTALRLEAESLKVGKSPASILSEVVARYVHYKGWQQDLLELSLEGADQGDFAAPEAVTSAFMRWGVATVPTPALLWSGLALRAFRKELEHIGKNSPNAATELANLAWQVTQDENLASHAFPGMVQGSLETPLGSGDYCLAFREKDEKREIVGVVPCM